MTRNILLFISFSFLFASCGAFKNNKTTIFTKQEKELILSGKSDEPMRVFLIANSKDSVVLRSKSKSFIPNQSNKVLAHFTSRLYQTVRDSATRGVGIAAPQVGILKKIIWIQRFDKKNEPFEVYFNPRIRKYSKLKQDVREACLSIPNISEVLHSRAHTILLEYDNLKGEHKCEMIEAFTAVIFQHEIDHLDGILFTDHLEKERKQSINHNIK